MYYTHPGCRTSIFGENRAYCIRDFTVHIKKMIAKPIDVTLFHLISVSVCHMAC